MRRDDSKTRYRVIAEVDLHTLVRRVDGSLCVRTIRVDETALVDADTEDRARAGFLADWAAVHPKIHDVRTVDRSHKARRECPVEGEPCDATMQASE